MDPNIVESITQDSLQVPSHVVFNHANYHRFGGGNDHVTDCSELSSVAITQRLSRSKYMTLIYYKSVETNAN